MQALLMELLRLMLLLMVLLLAPLAPSGQRLRPSTHPLARDNTRRTLSLLMLTRERCLSKSNNAITNSLACATGADAGGVVLQLVLLVLVTALLVSIALGTQAELPWLMLLLLMAPVMLVPWPLIHAIWFCRPPEVC